MQSIFLIDKPKGITSFDVIRRLKTKIGGLKRGLKVGHAGTLDPLATGLMIIGVGEGTKKLNEYLKLPKSYEAEIIIGESRTTGDAEGEVIETKPVNTLTEDAVEEALSAMVGENTLPVPRYAAVKVKGEPLYKKARRGEEFEVPKRVMQVHGAELLNIKKEGKYCALTVSFDVASGVYIRSLAEELGRLLGYPASIRELRRTRIGEFDIKDAEPIT